MNKRGSGIFKCLKGRLCDALFGDDGALLAEALTKVGDGEVAHLMDSLAPKQKLKAFKALPPGRRVKVLLDLGEYSFETVLPRLPFDDVWEMVRAADSDDAADIIQWLDTVVRDKVIDRLKKDDPRGLLPLLVFEEHTAGGRTKTEVLKFRDIVTVDEARVAVARDAEAKRKSHYIYVVDSGERLLGRLSPVRLLQESAERKLTGVMDPSVEPLSADMGQEEVARVFDERDAVELPVINRKGMLLGVITADDVFAVMEEEYCDDVVRMAGVNEDARIGDPIWLSARRRIPWLAVNMITALAAAAVVGAFQGTISQIVILAAFMPVIAGMGGNAAQQSLAITVRAIALDEMRHVRVAGLIVKEIVVGSMIGLMSGVVAGLLASVYTGDPAIGAVIVMAMTLNLIMAGLVGIGVPLVMRALKADPALASTVFVTAATDIFGFFVFLGLAAVLLT